MSPWIIWLSIAALLLIVEVLTQMVWTLCLAIGALAGLVANLAGLSLAWQLVLMAVMAIIAYGILAPYLQRWHARQIEKKGRAARTGMDALLGRRAVVTDEIKPGETGRVRIDGDSWQAVSPGHQSVIRRGSEVTVSAYDSIILTVSPL